MKTPKERGKKVALLCIYSARTKQKRGKKSALVGERMSQQKIYKKRRRRWGVFESIVTHAMYREKYMLAPYTSGQKKKKEELGVGINSLACRQGKVKQGLN